MQFFVLISIHNHNHSYSHLCSTGDRKQPCEVQGPCPGQLNDIPLDIHPMLRAQILRGYPVTGQHINPGPPFAGCQPQAGRHPVDIGHDLAEDEVERCRWPQWFRRAEEFLSDTQQPRDSVVGERGR